MLLLANPLGSRTVLMVGGRILNKLEAPEHALRSIQPLNMAMMMMMRPRYEIGWAPAVSTPRRERGPKGLV